MRRSILLMPLVLAACATGPVERGTAIETTVQGQPLAGTNCVVSTAAGSWNIVTPTVLDLGPPSGDLRVICNRDGFRTSEAIYRINVHGTGPSIGLGIGGGAGNVGASVGMSVPFGGTGTTPRYPSVVRVEMNPQ